MQTMHYSTRAFSVRLSSVLLLAGVMGLGATRAVAVPKAVRLTNVDPQHTAWLRVPDSSTLEPQQFTLEIWITPMGPGYGNTNDSWGAQVLGKPREGASGYWLSSYALCWSPLTYKLNFGLAHTYSSHGISLSSNGNVVIGQTAHVAVVFDGQEVRLFIDGQPDSSCDFPYQGVYYGAEDILLGAGNYLYPWLRRFDGVIDDVRMWNYPRNEEEIARDMNCLLAGNETGLLAWWSFDNDQLTDNSGNGHDAQMNGVEGMATYVPPNAQIVPCGATAMEGPVAELGARGYVRPNPIQSSAVMALWSRQSGPVEAEVFSAAGRSVRTLRGMSHGGGLVEFLWDGADEGGGRVPAGVYFVRMPTEHGTNSQRLVIVR